MLKSLLILFGYSGHRSPMLVKYQRYFLLVDLYRFGKNALSGVGPRDSVIADIDYALAELLVEIAR